jgi:citrate synthase
VERRRNSPFAERVATRIWDERPSDGNPYLADSHRVHGYALDELAGRCDATDLLYLMLRGELPDAPRHDLLRRLSVCAVSPGPRHPALRAVMNAAASGTERAHLLPLGLALFGGEHQGVTEVAAAAGFIARRLRHEPADVARELLALPPSGHDQQQLLAPGFGRHFGERDPWAERMAGILQASPGAGSALVWGQALHERLTSADCGWLPGGVVAAAGLDLGLPARTVGPLYQALVVPAVLAHGLEMAGRTIHDLPFVDDGRYEIVEEDPVR